MGRLDDQVVLITGGASGLGKAIVERFVKEGARLCVVDRSADSLDEVVAEQGDAAFGCVGDVRSVQAMTDAVGQTVERYGKLDAVIGNAGIWDYSLKLDDMDADALDGAFAEIFDVNVKGYITLAKAALPALVRSRGAIIYTVSNAGFDPSGGGVLYTASKHAVVGIVRQLAFELGPAVRVNGVAPGPINTKLRGPESLGQEEQTIDSLDLPGNVSRHLAIQRVPTTAEYAGTYVYLASREDAVPATGGVVKVDCGIGVRGMTRPSLGAGLLEKYGK